MERAEAFAHFPVTGRSRSFVQAGIPTVPRPMQSPYSLHWLRVHRRCSRTLKPREMGMSLDPEHRLWWHPGHWGCRGTSPLGTRQGVRGMSRGPSNGDRYHAAGEWQAGLARLETRFGRDANEGTIGRGFHRQCWVLGPTRTFWAQDVCILGIQFIVLVPTVGTLRTIMDDFARVGLGSEQGI